MAHTRDDDVQIEDARHGMCHSGDRNVLNGANRAFLSEWQEFVSGHRWFLGVVARRAPRHRRGTMSAIGTGRSGRWRERNSNEHCVAVVNVAVVIVAVVM